ncbi:MAG: efflux RND transporter periplasmic adaptor subunit [Kofleriaceae bacterium]
MPVARQSSRSRSSARAHAPQAAHPSLPVSDGAQLPPGAIPVPGMGMIDPLQMPIPPQVAPVIYGWVRRLALQADLEAADRVLREAFIDITSSLTISIVYPGPEGLWTLGNDDEILRDAQPVIAVAGARQALIASHTAMIPIITTTETVAVVVLNRNPRQPGYTLPERVSMVGLAREVASIVHHLVTQHLEHAAEVNADKGGLYRREALEAHRTRGQEGALIQLSPTWVRRTYPFLMYSLLIAIVFAAFITVPTYSSGSGVVMVNGTPVTAPQMGTVEAVLVQPGVAVNEGTPVVKLVASQETDELKNAKTELDNATISYLFDQTDQETKKVLASAHARVVLAKSRVDAKTVRATNGGTVLDIRVRTGQLLQPGDHILTVVEPGASPEMVALLPSQDLPRLRKGQTLQVELAGYTKSREKATITSVASEAIGSGEAAKFFGATIADALQLPPTGSYVIVKAQLPHRTFTTDHHTYHYHHGMMAKTEVKIASKPFLVTLLPALGKYLPN